MRQGPYGTVGSAIAAVQRAGLMKSLATFQQDTVGLDSLGQVDLTTWTNVPGLVGIPCMKAVHKNATPDLAGKDRKVESVDQKEDYHTLLNGYYPQVSKAYSCVVDGVRYQIISVQHDSQGTMTRLGLQIWIQ